MTPAGLALWERFRADHAAEEGGYLQQALARACTAARSCELGQGQLEFFVDMLKEMRADVRLALGLDLCKTVAAFKRPELVDTPAGRRLWGELEALKAVPLPTLETTTVRKQEQLLREARSAGTIAMVTAVGAWQKAHASRVGYLSVRTAAAQVVRAAERFTQLDGGLAALTAMRWGAQGERLVGLLRPKLTALTFRNLDTPYLPDAMGNIPPAAVVVA